MSKAAATRQMILQKAFELIYTQGYQTTSIDDIIATTKVTKGAFYYHFKTKDEMGIAIIRELLQPIMTEHFVNPLKAAADPLTAIWNMTKHLLMESPEMKIEYGCPAGNLVQEMTPWNEPFRQVLEIMVGTWKEALEQCLTNGRKSGLLRKDINVSQVACHIMAGYWGVRNLGKVYNNADCYKTYLKELKSYLNGLK